MDADLLGKRSPLIGNRHLNQKGGRNAIGIGGRNRIGMGGRNAIGISGRNQIGMGGRNVSESAPRARFATLKSLPGWLNPSPPMTTAVWEENGAA